MKNFKFKTAQQMILATVAISSLPTQSMAIERLLIHGDTEEWTIHIDNLDKITFDDDGMQVLSINGSEDSYISFNDMVMMTFEEGIQSGIDDVEISTSDDFSYIYQPSTQELTVLSANGISSIEIYSIQGHLIHSSQMTVAETTISLSQQPAGIYIVRVGNGVTFNSYKFIKY